MASSATQPKTVCHDQNAELVFVFVHGTFAAGSGWGGATSKLYGAIREGFAETAIACYTFEWPGKVLGRDNNSQRCRERAGMELARIVNQLKAEHRESAQYFLLGHSHGGNVIFYAVDELEEKDIAGIVTFSTPFLHVIERSGVLVWSTAIIAAAVAIVGCLVGYFAVLVRTYQLASGDEASRSSLWNILFWLLVFLPVIASVYYFGSAFWATKHPSSLFAKRLDLKLRESSDQRIGKLSGFISRIRPRLLPEKTDEEVFVASSAFDEAHLLLTIHDLPARFLRSRLVIGAFSAWICTWAYHTPSLQNQLKMYAGEPLYVAGPIFVLLFAFSFVVMNLGLSLLRMLMAGPIWGYGFINPLASLICDLTVEKVPPGVTRWHGYKIPGGGLAHSRLYDSDIVIRDVVEWLNKKINTSIN